MPGALQGFASGDDQRAVDLCLSLCCLDWTLGKSEHAQFLKSEPRMGSFRGGACPSPVDVAAPVTTSFLLLLVRHLLLVAWHLLLLAWHLLLSIRSLKHKLQTVGSGSFGMSFRRCCRLKLRIFTLLHTARSVLKTAGLSLL